MKPVEPDNSKLQNDEPQRRSPARGAYAYAPGSRVLAGYVIKRGLGQGGFGEVYYAVSDAGKDVALKLVRRNLEVELRGVMQCLNVKHPNLIGLYDVKVDDQENHWIVMEYVAGERLTEIIERNPQGLPPAEAIKILRGIGAGVGYLHGAGIVHRDLKPANIFVENGFIKIGDYGLSKFISSSRRSGQTESVGTVHYMAPEIANGRYGKQIDIYALGVLFYELLTGKLPFDGESVGEILMKHLTAEPDLAAVTEPYRAAIAGALKKDPEDRPRSVAAFLAAIDPSADSAALAAAGESIATHRAAAAPNRSSRADFPPSPPAGAANTSHGFLSRLRANLLPHGANVKSLVIVAVAMIAGVALAGAVIPLVILGVWVWLVVAIVRTVRGDAKQARSAFREGRGLELRATEAHVDGTRPKTFGRRVAMAIGLVVVTAMLFGSIASNRTVERIEVPRGSQVSIVEPLSTKVVAIPHDAAEIRHHDDPHATSPRFSSRKLGLVGLVSVIAVVSVVGLSIAVGRKARSNESEARKLLAATQLPVQPTLRGLAIDITGSLLLMFGATIVVNRLLLLVLVDRVGVTPYLWSTATTFVAVSLTALVIKAVHYLDRESSGRRLAFFAVGVAVGAASWVFAEYLGYPIPLDGGWSRMRVGIKTSSWPECYVDGVPTVLAFMGYYGLSFLAIDWWSMTAAKRGSRWRIGDAFVAVFWAGAVHFVFPFPQPWGVLTAAGTALVLPFAFPLPPRKMRSRVAAYADGGRA